MIHQVGTCEPSTLSLSLSLFLSSSHQTIGVYSSRRGALVYGVALSLRPHHIKISRGRSADFAPGMLAVGRGGLSVVMSHQDSAHAERPQACLEWSSRTGLPNNVIAI